MTTLKVKTLKGMNETMAKVTNITEATSGREEDVRLLMMSSTLLTFITLLDIV